MARGVGTVADVDGDRVAAATLMIGCRTKSQYPSRTDTKRRRIRPGERVANIVIVGVGGRHRQYRGLVLRNTNGVHHVHQRGRTTGRPTTGNVLRNHRRRGAGGGTAQRTFRQRVTGKTKEVKVNEKKPKGKNWSRDAGEETKVASLIKEGK